MAIVYDIFAGNESGGPADLSAPLVTTAALSVSLSQAPGTARRYLVRARDTVTGLSCGNADAQALVTLGPDGSDLTGLPAAPGHIRASPGPDGTATVEWTWPYLTGPFPTRFTVYYGVGPVDYTAGRSVVPYAPAGATRFSSRARLVGLAPGTTYAVGVRARNAAGEESNTLAVSLALPASAAVSVSGLSASATY